MPTVIRKSSATLLDTRREVLHAVSWQVRSHVWSPPTDEYENEETYVVLVEIAGMRDDDFEISLEKQHIAGFGARPDFLERRALSANGNSFWKI